MVFFYYANPKSSNDISSAHSFYSRHFFFHLENTCEEEIDNTFFEFLVGDQIYAKPSPMLYASIDVKFDIDSEPNKVFVSLRPCCFDDFVLRSFFMLFIWECCVFVCFNCFCLFLFVCCFELSIF